MLRIQDNEEGCLIEDISAWTEGGGVRVPEGRKFETVNLELKEYIQGFYST